MKKLLLSAAMMAALSASAQSTTVRPKYVSTSGETIDTELVQQAETRLTRIFYQGYNTVCLPYALTAEEVSSMLGEDVTVEKPVGAFVENNDFVLCFGDCTGEGMEAGMPYLVHSEKAKYVTITNSTGMSVNAPASVSFVDGRGNVATFQGSFERLQPVGTWAIPAVQGEVPANLICCDGARQLNPTRCFFTWDAQNGASNMIIRHLANGETVTGITAANITTAEGFTYNTAGQRVQNGHGVMIQGGKKIVK